MAKKVILYRTERIGEFTMSGSGSNYGCGNFLLDAFLTVITGGLWIIVIIVRELRK